MWLTLPIGIAAFMRGDDKEVFGRAELLVCKFHGIGRGEMQIDRVFKARYVVEMVLNVLKYDCRKLGGHAHSRGKLRGCVMCRF